MLGAVISLTWTYDTENVAAAGNISQKKNLPGYIKPTNLPQEKQIQYGSMCFLQWSYQPPLCVSMSSRWGPAHTDPALVLSARSPILHGQSGADRSGLALDVEEERGRRLYSRGDYWRNYWAARLIFHPVENLYGCLVHLCSWLFFTICLCQWVYLRRPQRRQTQLTASPRSISEIEVFLSHFKLWNSSFFCRQLLLQFLSHCSRRRSHPIGC